MSSAVYKNLSDQIDMLSYADRLRLLEKIVMTLGVPKTTRQKPVSGEFDAAFGLWRDRDISLDSIRAKAWGRE